MRGQADEQAPLFHVFSVEDRIRPDHPLRDIKRRVDRILEGMSAQFAEAYSRTGRPSVPPERLLKALLLMALYSVRSERQLCERIDTDLLFRWFLDLQPSEAAFDATTLTHNRQRLDDHDLTRTFFAAVVREAIAAGLCSEHFSVDGTLIESFAAAKSFRPTDAADDDPKDANGFQPRNVAVDFHGQKRTNDTHQSRTDPEAKLYRKSKGQEAKLAHMGHTLGENRHGLIMAVAVTEANGTAERTAALDMLDELKATHGMQPTTLGADKGFDSGKFFQDLEARRIEPHVPLVKEPRDPAEAPHHKQRPGVAARQRMKTRMMSEGYRHSQKCRK
jgi:transposase